MKSIKLSERHHVLMYDDLFPGMYLNLHIILAQYHTFIIDSGMGSDHYHDIMALVTRYQRKQPLILINTHDHWDHVWGNGFFTAQIILAHKTCYTVLERDWDRCVEHYGSLAQGTIAKALPNTLFDSEICFPQDQIMIGYAPGHSISDIYVYDSCERVLNVGDNIGDNDATPIPDLETSFEQFEKSIRHYQTLKPKIIVSGHNRIQTPDFLDVILADINQKYR